MVSLSSEAYAPLNKIAGALLTIVVVTNSGYMLMVTKGHASDILYLCCILASIFTLNGLILHIRTRGNEGCQSRIGFLAVLSVLVSATAFVNAESPGSYAHIIAMLVIGCYLSLRVPFQVFIKAVSTVMCFIVIISLLFYSVMYFMGPPAPISMVNTSVSATNYYNYGLFFYPQTYAETLSRNQAIFWEPGLFAGFCIMALCLEIAFREKPNIWKIIILVLGILTSGSSSGIILLVLIAVIAVERFLRNSRLRVLVEFSIAISFLIALLLLPLALDYLATAFPGVFGKLVGDEVTTTTRLAAPLVNMSIFLQNPIFGSGIHGANEAFTSVKTVYGIDSQTSTSTYLMAAFGIAGVVMNIVLLLALAKSRMINHAQKVFVIVLFIVLINMEPYQELAFLWILLFYFIGESTLEKERKPKFNDCAD